MIDALRREIAGVRQSFIDELNDSQSPSALSQLREKYFSRKRGIVSLLLERLKEFDPATRPAAGKEVNALKEFVRQRLREAEEKQSQAPAAASVDYSLPEFAFPFGRIHLLSQIRAEIEDIFLNMGYAIARGPEIESEFHNFTALNFAEYHPARDEQDTFLLEGFPELILRTHTSPVQIRYMLTHPPPIKIVSPGRVYRKDEVDATHSPVFHQVEGLLIDRGISFSHLKGTLELFSKTFFGPDIRLRFRPSYFPFTEPSAEVDISCFLCGGGQSATAQPDCRICHGSGWLEILGSGMVHPQVLRNCRIDPETYSGFAFGMGVERIALIKYGISDMRMLYENDLRFNSQFG